MSAKNQKFELEDAGILNETILLLVFQSINFDVHALSLASCVSRKLRAVADRILWRQLCVHRAPRMIATLSNGALGSRIGGGWPALAKLLFFCCGCGSGSVPGHFVNSSRFSKTSGRSFLARGCGDDLVYVSDPCEHPTGDREDHLGIYRGVFRGFLKSKTRSLLIRKRAGLEERERCPYCGARVWSMRAAGLVPKSAARRLGSRDDGVEYFVCVSGHLYGTCLLVPLSSDEHLSDIDEDGDEDEYDDDFFETGDRSGTNVSLGNGVTA